LIIVPYLIPLPTVGQYFALLAHAWFFVVIVLTVLYAFRQLANIDRTRSVERLYEESVDDLNQRFEFDNTLDSLLEIGRQGGAGFEKTEVLLKLKDLASHYIRLIPQNQYDGTGLRPLIRGIEDVVANGSAYGSSTNFLEAARILEYIMRKLSRQHDETANMRDTITVTERLALISLDRFSRDVQMAMLNALAEGRTTPRPEYSRIYPALREIGIQAIRCGHYSIATTALSHLLTWDGGEVTGEHAIDVLGLAAHIWQHNDGGRTYIEQIILFHDGRFQPSLDECLEEAAAKHLDRTNFDTYACIRALQQDLDDRNEPNEYDSAAD
jgi:hypothetical protein